MDRLGPALIVAAVLVVLLGLMLLGWRGRRRRQAGIAGPTELPAGLGEPSSRIGILHVATTRAEQPLERIAVHGLGFRARGEIGLHPAGAPAGDGEDAPVGVVLALTGREPLFIPAADLRGAGRATWTIDRVVERDGLVLLRWELAGTAVDSYLRITDDSPIDALVAAIAAIAPDADPIEGT